MGLGLGLGLSRAKAVVSGRGARRTNADDGGLGVAAEAEPVAEAGAERHHVLERTAWVCNAVGSTESATLAEVHGRNAASLWALGGSAARSECGPQRGAWRANPNPNPGERTPALAKAAGYHCTITPSRGPLLACGVAELRTGDVHDGVDLEVGRVEDLVRG